MSRSAVLIARSAKSSGPGAQALGGYDADLCFA